MAKYKESKENPLHREFGRLSNARYVLGKCRRYSPSAIPLALIGILCSSVTSYYLGFFTKLVIDLLQRGGGQDLPALMRIVVPGALVGALLQLGNVLSGSKTWYRYIHVRMRVIEERVARVLRIPYEALENPDMLDLHERACQATGDNSSGFEGMMHLMQTLAVNLTTVAVTLVAVLALDLRLVLALAALALIEYAYHTYCIRTDKKRVWDVLSPTWRQLHYMERVTQDFDYAKDIRLFSLSDFLLGKQQRVYEKRWKTLDFHQNLWLSHGVVVTAAVFVSKAAIYAVMFHAVLQKGMTVGDFTLCMALAMAFSGSLIEFLRRFGDFSRTSLEVDDLRSFLELDMLPDTGTGKPPAADGYRIEFRGVSYRYHGAEKWALRDLNLTIEPGERLAVVGLNGAGKTTMIKLLLRLYDPTEGSILLNGVDIRTYSREEYYRLFSPVFQNVEVLAFPLFEMISMKPGDETDMARAAACADEAGLGERVKSLPKGLETELLKVVDDDGVDLSGGEKQKLALARALYKDAPIVVLDEPTSALDAIAEQRLYESFDSMIGRKSAVYISHRLASTRFCDHVAMFRDGRMIEYGTHDQLMNMHGEYARMFDMQAQYYQKEEADA